MDFNENWWTFEGFWWQKLWNWMDCNETWWFLNQIPWKNMMLTKCLWELTCRMSTIFLFLTNDNMTLLWPWSPVTHGAPRDRWARRRESGKSGPTPLKIIMKALRRVDSVSFKCHNLPDYLLFHNFKWLLFIHYVMFDQNE